MKITIGDYLIRRIKELGIKHIIGVPGDFNLQFLEQIEASEGIEFVGASNELNAAYAADGYSREHGISALCVTYGVGDLGAIGGIAGSAAEHIPVISISGIPPLFAKRHNYKVHHSLADGNFSNIANTYKEFTVVQTLVTQQNAKEEIDRALRAAVRYKRPVNIQLPSNLSYYFIDVDEEPLLPESHVSDEKSLNDAIKEIIMLYEKSNSPVVLVDMDVDRLEVTKEILQFIEKTQTPFAQMSTGKAILDENHPLFIGTYKGNDSEEYVKDKVENADFLLSVSPRFIEWNSGTYSDDLPMEYLVRLDKDYTFVGDEIYEGIDIKDVLNEILNRVEEKTERYNLNKNEEDEFTFEKEKNINHEDFWKQIKPFLKEEDLIYGETGTTSQALGEIIMPKGTKYIASLIWGAIGFTLPALFGSLLVNPKRRQILFIGDGSFQVTAQELSRILYKELNPIIFVINNDGYTIERYILGMEASYNDIPLWNYHELPHHFVKNNKMLTFNVKTQGELQEAMEKSKEATHGVLIEVHFDKQDAPETLKKFGPAVANFNFGERGMEDMGEEERIDEEINT
ncbi:MAG: alpha-keto acid decarboxylase family protein [Tissierellia bacterium]|nr:alpha-keto acid decarboxylase family protein [Tissierellia bacterium]